MSVNDDITRDHSGVPVPRGFRIRIDRTAYTVTQGKLSGAELRRVPPTPIPPDLDLYLVVPGDDDRKIKDDDTVEMRDGLRFVTKSHSGVPVPRGFRIRIDRTEYTVTQGKLSGAELRRVPPTPVPPDRDLYLVVPGDDDRKIKDDDTVEMRDGLRFFTAPSTINPGMESTDTLP